MVVKGQNRDTVWFSMLDSEWPEIRADRYKGILD
jgi:RimJ/RimL family protein N-acetyltransferase